MPLTPEQARQANDAAKAEHREDERRCRADFLVNPDHAEVCRHGCSRDYDVAPPMLSLVGAEDRQARRNGGEAWAPTGDFYSGTGVGALYDGPMTSAQAATLAGWNIHRGRRPE